MAYEPINVLEIFERDGWRCHLCGKRVKRKRAFDVDPMGASLDHIIPMSLGGPHLKHNVACAHLICNSLKGAGGNDQLLLVG